MEKKHRLDKEAYLGEIAVAYTCCIFNKDNLFKEPGVIKQFEEILLKELAAFDLGVYIYLFMPNHLHLITSGKDRSSNHLSFMKSFKQKTGYWLSKNLNCHKWQKDFYDHIIRNYEDINNQVYYILNNPVRAGIVNHWKEYPYKGSTEFNLDEIER